MNRRHSMLLAAAALWPHRLVGAQGDPRTARIGFLAPGAAPSAGSRHPWELIFIHRLRDLGWVEGRNLVIEFRYGGGRAVAQPVLAAELVALRPDLIIAPGTPVIRAVRDATATIPIVMAAGGDPVGTGLVASLARPGGNITGLSQQGQEVIPKGLNLLHEAVPQARRIDLLGNAANPGNPFFAKVFVQAARERGLEGELVAVRSVDELEAVIASTRADALLELADPLFFIHRQRIADAAIKRRLPLADMAGRYYAQAGNLMSYAIANDDIWRLAADYADRILRGGKPAEMPVEQVSRYELFLNLKTAKAIGLSFPQALRLRADEVIE